MIGDAFQAAQDQREAEAWKLAQLTATLLCGTLAQGVHRNNIDAALNMAAEILEKSRDRVRT